MTTRIVAASFLVLSAAIAWVTVTVPLAARALQLAIALSMAYVGWLAWRGARVIRAAGEADAAAPPSEPTFVTLVLPARNEEPVIAAATAAVRDLDYPGRDGRPAYEVIVVDDGSTDETAERARAAAGDAAHVRVIHREPGDGPRTKGAVLAHAMSFAGGAVVGAIDADTRVGADFLARAMRAWERDPEAAALQVARMPRNAATSWLTAAQAEEQLMDLASQCGRWAVDGTAELRGNGMFVRRDALDAVGGWGQRALTEDLDLSTRLAAAGYHVALAPEVPIGEEAVETVGALIRQRLRWAEGSLRRLIDHGPGLMAGGQPLARKADFLAFTAEFLLPPLFVAATLASLVTVVLPQPADWTVPASLFAGYGLGVFLLALAGLSAVGVRGAPLVGRALRGALFLSHWLLVVPVALVRIAFGRGTSPFTQTPRFAAGSDR